METLATLNRRREALGSLGSVVRTMKGLAAVSLHQYEDSAKSLLLMQEVVEQALHALLQPSSGLGEHSFPEHSRVPFFLVVGTDLGMAGPLNQRLIAKVLDELGPQRAGGPLEAKRLVVVGRRTAARLEDQGVEVGTTLATPSSQAGVLDVVFEMLDAVDAGVNLFGAPAKRRSVVAHFSQREDSGTIVPCRRQIFPPSGEWLRRLRSSPWNSRSQPMVQGDPERAMGQVMRMLLFVSLFRTLVAALESEHLSRLRVMRSAESEIERREGYFDAEIRRVRDANVTTELHEVISGFEVATGIGRRG